MSSKKVFFDKDGNELNAHINSDGNLYIEIGNPDNEYSFGFIVLNNEDTVELIEYLTELERGM